MLSTDSSPQGGLDYMMTLEDHVTREAAGNLMLVGDNSNAILQWSRQQGVQTTQLHWRSWEAEAVNYPANSKLFFTGSEHCAEPSSMKALVGDLK